MLCVLEQVDMRDGRRGAWGEASRARLLTTRHPVRRQAPGGATRARAGRGRFCHFSSACSSAVKTNSMKLTAIVAGLALAAGTVRMRRGALATLPDLICVLKTGD
jgi:hypothetical protein